VTTHVALVARAFGADKIFITTRDKKIEDNIKSVCRKFGGKFEIETGVNEKKLIGQWRGTVVHLTMYGVRLDDAMKKLDKNKDVLVVVGSEKVSSDIYQLADFNVSIGNQPHSEVAALAIFLDRYTNGEWQKKQFNDGKIKIIPTEKGKKVIQKNKIPLFSEKKLKTEALFVDVKMTSIPDPEKCIELLREKGCSNEVIRHCIAVRNIAVKIAEKAGADVKLVEAGALLHDIGRSKTHGIMHGIEGAKIAKEMGLPDSIIKIIERHIGAGIPETEAKKLGLPPKDYIPQTLEEKIVAHADNLVDNYKKQDIKKEIEKALKKGQKKYAKRLLQLHKELSRICGIDLDSII